MKPLSEVKLMDCMDYMRGFPDKFFELAVVNPPYGIGANKMTLGNGKKRVFRGSADWDASPPGEDYFRELFRVSENQIIWGGNYFIEYLKNTSCFVFWDKGTGSNSYADGELAWTSYAGVVRKYSQSWVGNNAKDEAARQHPTQKPIGLYEWLLKNYANPGDKILDTHLGSQSSRIAAYKLGFDFYGTEIDADYFNEGCARFEISIAMPLFDSIEIPEQLKMF